MKHTSDGRRMLWLVPVVAVILVGIELVMTGRLGRAGWIDVAIGGTMAALAIQVAVRTAAGIVPVALVYVLFFTLSWYALTLFVPGGATDLRTGETPLIRDGALTLQGHLHFLFRPFLFSIFTLLMSFLFLWGWSAGPRGGK